MTKSHCEQVALQGIRVFLGRILRPRLREPALVAELLTRAGHRSEINSARFDPYQLFVLTAGCDNARLWHLATGAELMTFPAPDVDARDAAFSHDGERAAIALGLLDATAPILLLSYGTLPRYPQLSGIQRSFSAPAVLAALAT